MSRNLIKIAVLALVCALAATGCKKKTPAASGADNLPPIGSGTEQLGPIGGGIPETPTTPGVALSGPNGKYVVHFDYDSAVVSHDQNVLQEVVALMKSKSTLNVTVTGHCDERGSVQYNLSLGEHRALSVRAYLIGLGIDGSRLSTQSFGKEQPSSQGHDESAWRENRRAEFIAR